MAAVITMARVPAPSELAAEIEALNFRLNALTADHEALIRAAGRLERRVAQLESEKKRLTATQLLRQLFRRVTGQNG